MINSTIIINYVGDSNGSNNDDDNFMVSPDIPAWVRILTVHQYMEENDNQMIFEWKRICCFFSIIYITDYNMY